MQRRINSKPAMTVEVSHGYFAPEVSNLDVMEILSPDGAESLRASGKVSRRGRIKCPAPNEGENTACHVRFIAISLKEIFLKATGESRAIRPAGDVNSSFTSCLPIANLQTPY
jgi:hypothetical protein